MVKRLILAINPGSTSTKFSLFEEDNLVFENTLRHSVGELSPFKKITEQFQFRKELIMKDLHEHNVDFSRIKAVIGRGGLLKPIESGIYHVNQKMKDDLVSMKYGEHASNLGALIADDIASSICGAIACIVDPVVVDEMQEIARLSGHPEIERRSIFHALNQKAVARLYSASVNSKYEDLNLIVAHMGGGVSIGAHKRGRIIDVNNALNGDGPFSPERSGGLPAGQLVDLCFSGKYTHAEIKSMLTGKGGMVAYLGTNSFIEANKLAEAGDQKARLVKKAMAYQIAKEIGAAAAVLNGRVHQNTGDCHITVPAKLQWFALQNAWQLSLQEQV
ncbi:MAG TPA: butyrate kinase [Bacteroidales bacterium]|nr:butyrate kinase [Bacteroidales bacterium]